MVCPDLRCGQNRRGGARRGQQEMGPETRALGPGGAQSGARRPPAARTRTRPRWMMTATSSRGEAATLRTSLPPKALGDTERKTPVCAQMRTEVERPADTPLSSARLGTHPFSADMVGGAAEGARSPGGRSPRPPVGVAEEQAGVSQTSASLPDTVTSLCPV